MVARVDVAVELHHAGMAARPCHGAHAGLFAHPVGQRGVEDLDVVCAHVLLDPQVEQTAEEVAPLFGADGEVGQRRVTAVGQRGQVASVAVGQDALHDGGKLDVVASQVLEEAVELVGIVGVVVVHHRHAVPLHPVLLQQVDALHHLVERGASLLVLAVLVVELLRAVDGDAHQPVVLLEEPAPLVGEQRAVGLDAVVDGASAGIFLLQLHGPLVERQGAHQRLSAVPGEEHLRHGLRLDVFFDELLQQLLAHHVLGIVLVEFGLFQVVTIVACQVAYGSYGFQHHVERFGERCVGRHVRFLLLFY